MLHCPDYNVTKSQNRRCWLPWAKPKPKCDCINYFWVAKTTCSVTGSNGCLSRKNSL